MLAALITHASDSTSAARAKRPGAEQAFQALDGDGKGYLSADDLRVSISAEGARRAAAAGKGIQKLFARLDGDGDGRLTQQEFLAAVPKGLLAARGQSAQEAKAAAEKAAAAYASVERLGPGADEA